MSFDESEFYNVIIHYSNPIKIVLNKCYGGYGYSRAAVIRLKELGYKFNHHEQKYLDEKLNGSEAYFSFQPTGSRIDPLLVQVVEELGDAASGSGAKLVVEIQYFTYSYKELDGFETFQET